MSYLHEGMIVKDKIIYMPDEKTDPDPRGVGWVYFDCMSKNKDLMAQIDGPTGQKDSFGSLLQRSTRTAIAMQQKEIGYGDVVALCTLNHINSCVPHISSTFIGAKIVAIDPSLSVEAASYLLKQVMPKLIFVEESSVALIESVLKLIQSQALVVVFGRTTKYVSFDDFAKSSSKELQFEPVKAKSMEDVVIIMFSSGTSGFPKGICHTHKSILYASLQDRRDLKLNSDPLVFISDSPYWNVFMIALHYSIRNGTARLVYPGFNFKAPWSIFKYKITEMFLNVTELMTLVNTPKPNNIDLSSLVVVITGGSIIYDYQVRKARTVLNRLVLSMYGQTEVFPSIMSYDLKDDRHIKLVQKKEGTCGTLPVGVSCKIVDPDTEKVLGPNQPGEIRLKTKRGLSGYYHVASESVWDADGWLKTGDYGYYDDDYYFYIVDRVKEMFKYRYWHVVPAVVEKQILEHPAISKAVVIGIPHEVDNYHAMAIVVLKDTWVGISEKELEDCLNGLLEEREKLRKGVKIVDRFPLTPTGKVNRFKLKQLVLEGKI